jgi:hypothetical protein
MIRHRRKIKFSYIFATAIAVAIICLGSLINFHQYKIWGKPLIPQFVGIKRDAEKSGKTFLIAKSDKSNNVIQKYAHSTDLISFVECVRYCCGSGTFIISAPSQITPFRIPAGSVGLRAPPTA